MNATRADAVGLLWLNQYDHRIAACLRPRFGKCPRQRTGRRDTVRLAWLDVLRRYRER